MTTLATVCWQCGEQILHDCPIDADYRRAMASDLVTPLPVAPDSLVARLRNPSLSCSKGQRGDIHHEAANRIEQLESMLRVAVEENTELQGLVAIRHTTEG
jgi:hypothetical protein